MTQRSPNAVMPFFYLRSDHFWHLHPNAGYEAAVKSTNQMRASSSLREMIAYASLDEQLFILLTNKESREAIRQAIIDAYFKKSRQDIEGSISEGKKIYRYQMDLFEKTKKRFHVKEPELNVPIEFREVRSPAFRRAVMTLYQYTCAVCRMRIVTIDGLSAVDAGHIVPFSVSQNDDPRNGVALCKIHHWAFDNGLIGVDDNYKINVSKLLDANRPTEWLLTDLENEALALPANPQFHPSRQAFNWHRTNRFQS